MQGNSEMTKSNAVAQEEVRSLFEFNFSRMMEFEKN